MNRRFLSSIFCAVFLCAVAYSTTTTQIQYTASEIGDGRWQYTYDVVNLSLPEGIEEFTIWFDCGLYDNLAIETAEPLAGDWDEIVLQPEPVFGDDSAYDALALVSGIGIGENVNGFSVSFDWMGIGKPGEQFYEIIDPDTFETIDSGWTIPEPGTMILLSFGMLALHNRRRNL